MRLLACLIVAPQRGYDEPATLSYAISSFCPTSADGLHMGVLLGSRVLDFIRGDSGDHDGRADHVGGAILTSGASRHGCFLAVKPNQPEDDGEYGVPDVALPNVALPIARRQCGCLNKNPQYARPLG